VLLRDRVCVRNIWINTLHKGDSDDITTIIIIIIIMECNMCGIKKIINKKQYTVLS
jgi:hypothetical protein